MTTYLIIDTGIAFKLITPHPHRQVCINLATQRQHSGYQLCAPDLWVYEITSVFTKMARSGKLSMESSREGVRLAHQLGMQLMPPNEEQAIKAFAWTKRLQRAAAYDSFYLALAETLGCEFWTTDRKLANAVAQPWVKCVEDPDLTPK